jgi:hypothetical protein
LRRCAVVGRLYRVTPETTLLLAELRVGRSSALKRLARALKAHHGNVRDAAASLGLGERTLHRLREQSAAVAAVLAEHGMGRAGAATRATEVRAKKSTPS